VGTKESAATTHTTIENPLCAAPHSIVPQHVSMLKIHIPKAHFLSQIAPMGLEAGSSMASALASEPEGLTTSLPCGDEFILFQEKLQEGS